MVINEHKKAHALFPDACAHEKKFRYTYLCLFVYQIKENEPVGTYALWNYPQLQNVQS